MKAFLSIDWDYFVPENPRYDFGHTENRFFLSDVWATRAIAWRDRTNGLEKDFWSKVGFNDRDVVHVTDSHLHVTDNSALESSDLLVLVDRHHDAYSLPEEHVHCGNWVVDWLSGGNGRRVVWVPPSDVISTHIQHASHRFVVDPNFDLGRYRYTGVHVCRSGCWTPPWFDAAFIRFIQASGRHPFTPTSRLEWCDPLKPRWSLRHYRQMFAHERAMASARKAMESSGQFVL